MKHSITFDTLPRAKADGTHTIRMRVAYAGSRWQICLPCSVRDISRPTSEAADIMADYRSRVNRYFQEAGNTASLTALRTSFGTSAHTNEKSPSTGLYSALSRFVLEQGGDNDWAMSTAARFRSVMRHIEDYDRESAVTDITEDWVRGWVGHMYRQGLRNSTIDKNVKLFRWFCRWAHRKGIMQDTAADDYRPKFKAADRDVIYLTSDELAQLHDCDLHTAPWLEHVRDTFLFMCFSGLRYSDVSHLMPSDIHDGAISIVTAKTSERVIVELNAVSAAILSKYQGGAACDGHALPVMANQVFNRALKEVGKRAGIDAPVRRVWYVRNERREEVLPKWQLMTSHCGRRTFVVQGLSLGIPAEVMMRWTGHSDYKAMQPYIDIVSKAKKESMAKFDTLL